MRAKILKKSIKMQQNQNPCVSLESVEEIVMEGSIFICPICFKTMTDPNQIVECYQCQKLFCYEDYNHLSKKDCCPHCSLHPWQIAKLHPIYQEMLQQMTFHCQKCKQQADAKFTYAELEKHLEKVHDSTLTDKKEFKKYLIYLESGNSIELTKLQNLYVNYMLEQGSRRITIGDEGYNSYRLKVKINGEVSGSHSTLGSCYLINQKTELISGKNKLGVWEIDMDGEKIMLCMDLQTHLENGYRKYHEKPIKCETYFDLAKLRYRVNYIDMTQTNISTNFIRPLTRHILKY